MQAEKILERRGAKKLPALKLLIYQQGKLLRVEEIPDPREALIREYDTHGKEFGLRAAPG